MTELSMSDGRGPLKNIPFARETKNLKRLGPCRQKSASYISLSQAVFIRLARPMLLVGGSGSLHYSFLIRLQPFMSSGPTIRLVSRRIGTADSRLGGRMANGSI